MPLKTHWQSCMTTAQDTMTQPNAVLQPPLHRRSSARSDGLLHRPHLLQLPRSCSAMLSRVAQKRRGGLGMPARRRDQQRTRTTLCKALQGLAPLRKRCGPPWPRPSHHRNLVPHIRLVQYNGWTPVTPITTPIPTRTPVTLLLRSVRPCLLHRCDLGTRTRSSLRTTRTISEHTVALMIALQFLPRMSHPVALFSLQVPRATVTEDCEPLPPPGWRNNSTLTLVPTVFPNHYDQHHITTIISAPTY